MSRAAAKRVSLSPPRPPAPPVGFVCLMAMPGTVPTAPPQNVQAEAVNSTTIRFLWNPPPQQFINGINQGYKVRPRPDVPGGPGLGVSEEAAAPPGVTGVPQVLPPAVLLRSRAGFPQGVPDSSVSPEKGLPRNHPRRREPYLGGWDRVCRNHFLLGGTLPGERGPGALRDISIR